MDSKGILFEIQQELQQSEQDRKIIRFSREELLGYLSAILTPPQEFSRVSFELAQEKLRFDGFHLLCGEGRICIRAGQARGILHGVYELLRQLGCDFMFPGRHRQRLAHRDKLPSGIDIKKVPWIEYRGFCFYNTTQRTLLETLDAVDWMAKNGYNFLLTSIHRPDDTFIGEHAILWEEIGDILLPELQKRGIVIDMSEHATDYFFSRKELFVRHPEWFALKNGHRQPLQICYSNEEAVEAYGDSLARFSADKPWLTFMGSWPLDGGDYCECDACRDPLTIYRANMRIAEKIKRVRPDVILEHLAYTPQSFGCPEQELPENMSVLVCSVRNQTAYDWACSAKKGGGAFYFEYGTGDHYRMCSGLMLNPYHCREVVNTMVSYGYRGIVSLYLPVTSWWQASINYWYLRRFYYDPTADVESLTQELATLLFGPEKKREMADLIMQVYRKLQDRDIWSGMEQGHEAFYRHISNRNADLDELHIRQFEDAWESINQRLEKEKPSADSCYKKQFDLLQEYLKIIRLYYKQIDTFNAELDTQDKAEAYFIELAKCEEMEDNPFISEKYARWRITGRDNILMDNQDNLYQALEKRES